AGPTRASGAAQRLVRPTPRDSAGLRSPAPRDRVSADAPRACEYSSGLSTGARFPGMSVVDLADDELMTTFKPAKPSATDRSPSPGDPFRGSVAIARGHLTAHQLRTKCRRLFPDVYVDAMCVVTPSIIVRAAALWAPHGSVLGG